MIEWLKQNIIPGWTAQYANIKIEQYNNSLKKKEISITTGIDLDELIEQLISDLKNQMDRKKIIEDKAKSALGAITIAVTAITFAMTNQRTSLNYVFNIIVLFLLVTSILCFVMATIRSIQSLNIQRYFLYDSRLNITPEAIIFVNQSKKEKLKDLTKFKLMNDNTILQNSNYVYASFILIRNGLISFACFFIMGIIEQNLYKNPKNEMKSIPQISHTFIFQKNFDKS